MGCTKGFYFANHGTERGVPDRLVGMVIGHFLDQRKQQYELYKRWKSIVYSSTVCILLLELASRVQKTSRFIRISGYLGN
jgi:hypothetical protein